MFQHSRIMCHLLPRTNAQIAYIELSGTTSLGYETCGWGQFTAAAPPVWTMAPPLLHTAFVFRQPLCFVALGGNLRRLEPWANEIRPHTKMGATKSQGCPIHFNMPPTRSIFHSPCAYTPFTPSSDGNPRWRISIGTPGLCEDEARRHRVPRGNGLSAPACQASSRADTASTAGSKLDHTGWVYVAVTYARSIWSESNESGLGLYMHAIDGAISVK